MEGQDVELILTEQETAFMPPYHDAMDGIGDLFGRQDIVDAQWRIVDPVLDDVVLGPWHNPKPAALRP
jgi:glucose-6-phosphate 1-dehydrogenase